MAKSAAQKAAEKAAKEAQKPAGVCPVTEAPCEKSCDSDVCGAQPSSVEKQEKSSNEKSDYASHPKFDKFKSIQGAE